MTHNPINFNKLSPQRKTSTENLYYYDPYSIKKSLEQDPEYIQNKNESFFFQHTLSMICSWKSQV